MTATTSEHLPQPPRGLADHLAGSLAKLDGVENAWPEAIRPHRFQITLKLDHAGGRPPYTIFVDTERLARAVAETVEEEGFELDSVQGGIEMPRPVDELYPYEGDDHSACDRTFATVNVTLELHQ